MKTKSSLIFGLPIVLLFSAFISPASMAVQEKSSLADGSCETVLQCFFDSLIEKNYQDANEHFSPELLKALPMDNFEELMNELTGTKKGMEIVVSHPRSGLKTSVFYHPGSFEKLLKIEEKEFPGGMLWECLCRCSQKTLLFRIALDDAQHITGFQILPDPEDNAFDLFGDDNMHYYGNELLKRLGYFGQITLTTSNPENIKISAEGIIIWRKLESRDSKNHWQEYIGPLKVDHSEGTRPRQTVLKHLPVGEYYIAANRMDFRYSSECGPIVIDKNHREQSAVLPLKRLGSLSISLVDAESGEILEGAIVSSIRHKDRVTPSPQFFRSGNESKRFHYGYIPPGKYLVKATKSATQTTDRLYLPEQAEYEFDVPEGGPSSSDGHVDVTIKFHKSEWTQATKDEHCPFELSGIVTTPDGTPIPDAELNFNYYHTSAIRIREIPNVGIPFTTDENGRFSVKFSARELARYDSHREYYRAGSEQNWLKIHVRKNGYTEAVYDHEKAKQSIEQKLSNYHFVAVSPKPSPDDEKEHPRNTIVRSWINGPSEETPQHYPYEPQDIHLILVPASTMEVRLESDSAEDDSKQSPRAGELRLIGGSNAAPHFLKSGEPTQVSFQPGKDMSFVLGDNLFFWKYILVNRSPNFSLEKPGKYEVVLRWDVIERNGGIVRKLCIASFKDPDGENVPLTETPESTIYDYMFLRWPVKINVYDDQGNKISTARVGIGVSDERRTGGGNLLPDESGEYTRILPPLPRRLDPETKKPIGNGLEAYASAALDNKNTTTRFFLSDEDAGKLTTCDIVATRCSKATVEVLDENGKSLDLYTYRLEFGTEGALRYRNGTLFQNSRSSSPSREHTYFPAAYSKTPLWFVLYDTVSDKEKYWTSETVFLKPNEKYNITLRFLANENGEKTLTVEKAFDSYGIEVDIVVKPE